MKYKISELQLDRYDMFDFLQYKKVWMLQKHSCYEVTVLSILKSWLFQLQVVEIQLFDYYLFSWWTLVKYVGFVQQLGVWSTLTVNSYPYGWENSEPLQSAKRWWHFVIGPRWVIWPPLLLDRICLIEEKKDTIPEEMMNQYQAVTEL